MNDVRFVTVNGEAEFAVVPIALWNSLVAKVEQTRNADRMQPDPSLPAEVGENIVNGDHPVKAWRRHRRMTTVQLAAAISVSTSFVTLIETGRRNPSLRVLDRLAAALDAPPSSLDSRPSQCNVTSRRRL